MKILLVDDEPAILAAQSKILENWGYDVIAVNDGLKAWEILQDQPVNLVISDWMMPGISGIDLCARVRAAQLGRYVYFLLCTARDRREDIVTGLDAGADDFLVKPIDPAELRVRVRSGERVLDLEKRLEDQNAVLRAVNSELKDDLEAAVRMQFSLLPPPSPRAPGIQAEWLFQPCHYVAGDIFNLYAMDDCQTGFYILDVSGHGVPAAMLSVTLSMILRTETGGDSLLKKWNPKTSRQEATAPDQVIHSLNKQFASRDDSYFTMIYGIYDRADSSLNLSLAGQPLPILIKADGKTINLGEGGYPIGIWPQSEYESFRIPIESGDRLILYSDGVSECSNASGEQFGYTRLFEYFEQNAPTKTLKQLLSGLEQKLHEWNATAEGFDDDLSILALEFHNDDFKKERTS